MANCSNLGANAGEGGMRPGLLNDSDTEINIYHSPSNRNDSWQIALIWVRMRVREECGEYCLKWVPNGGALYGYSELRL